MEEKYGRKDRLAPTRAGVEITEPDEGRAARSLEHSQSPSEEPLSPASRLALERFVEKWKPYIDDPFRLDPPMRMIAQFVKKIAIEEGVIGEE